MLCLGFFASVFVLFLLFVFVCLFFLSFFFSRVL